MKTTRRTCLKMMATATGGLASGVIGTQLVTHLPNRPIKPFKALTPAEAAVIEACAEQIIPADQDPGARDAGVIFYIDKQLSRKFKKNLPTYQRAVISLDQMCQSLHKKNFIDLDFATQTQIMQALESNKVPANIWKDVSARDFFNLVREHTMQGFYGSPRHGGNKDYASYRMLGLDYPRLMGQNRYKEVL